MSDHVLNKGAPRVYHLPEDEHGHGESPTMLGFWIYLMSDALIFASLFSVYGVLSRNYAGGPAPQQIFDLPLVALNTAFLLVSSITFGAGMQAMDAGKVGSLKLWLIITGLLGAAFIGVELHEFSSLIADGATPQRSGFLSSFFTLVATHGLHVTFGLIWLVTMLVQIGTRGLTTETRRRLMCLSMFWHFLDIIWIGVFTTVYLFGVLR
ncbi:cytochrome o ubiquinol oxidase subunit III [Sphingomonas abietis]|uniref:Cytochrome bo(3) ubiquinol oxidase subunit 3 n=1 Tax=Sphingomonas abietis TaxID=3012344 RepID=A0ABY7NQE7_9SPHN|nr:cytochrome o ubiquinol oxidase subunit III [Sphingomonas abietis]WBO22843.1 cytochrome o ubiquinol oxidase subunit III [Sphingomonas abietis]